MENYYPFGSVYLQNVKNALMNSGHAAPGWTYNVAEHHIYGSSRIGVHQTNRSIASRFNNDAIIYTTLDTEYTSLTRGKRNYELSNHLGNVQVVISDKRVSVCDEYLGVDRFEAEVLSAMDYYPFGMLIPDRQWYANSDSSNYRFGFNGMERDNDISGQGNNLDFGARIYNSRLGRWMVTDPLEKSYPGVSSFNYASNSPTSMMDSDGMDGIRNGANSSITATMVFIYDPTSGVDRAEAIQAVENASTNIRNVWGEQTYRGQKVQTNLDVMFYTQDEYNEALANGQVQPTDGKTNVITLTNSGRSHVEADGRTGKWNVKELNGSGNTAAHEFGHLLGLSDRYQNVQQYTDQNGIANQGTAQNPVNYVEVSMPKSQVNHDPNYNPQDNMMANGTSTLTTQQLDFVFQGCNGSEGIEQRTYFTPSTLAPLRSSSTRPVFGTGLNGSEYSTNLPRMMTVSFSMSESFIKSLSTETFDFNTSPLRNYPPGSTPERSMAAHQDNQRGRFSSGSSTIDKIQEPY